MFIDEPICRFIINNSSQNRLKSLSKLFSPLLIIHLILVINNNIIILWIKIKGRLLDIDYSELILLLNDELFILYWILIVNYEIYLSLYVRHISVGLRLLMMVLSILLIIIFVEEDKINIMQEYRIYYY